MKERSTDSIATPSTDASGDDLLRRVAATDPPPRALAVPKVAGRYQVRRLLGRGGLGIVHVGWDPELQREVALKFVRPDHLRGPADEPRIDRLRREAQILARLDHAAIVRVFDIGEVGGQLWIAMELLDGPTLRVWARGETSWRRILAACLVAARGLAAAHGRGVIHRDFKPENVVVAGSRVVVVDFGLADEIAPASDGAADGGADPHSATVDGVVVGTRGYLAPELIAGGPATAASDQYAWCVTCSELLDPIEPRSLPQWLRRALQRGRADDPGDRFATMDEIVAVLERGAGFRRRIALASAGIALAWIAADALSEHRRATACDDAGDAIADVWNDETRADLRAGLLATQLPYGDEMADQLVPWIDRRAAQWKETRIAACSLARDEQWDAALLDRSTWCLDERRVELEAIVAALSRADEGAVRNAVGFTLATEMPPPTLCARAEVLAGLPEPPSASGRGELRRLTAELATAYALDVAGRFDEAASIAGLVAEQSAASQWPPLQLAARLRRGTALARAGRLEQARIELEAAYFGAEQIGWWNIAAPAAIRMIGTFPPDEIERAQQWSRTAEAALAQVPEDARLYECDRLTALARAHLAHGDRDRACQLFRAALAAAEELYGPDHPSSSAALRNLASALFERGELAESRRLLELALPRVERIMGPDHPATAAALNNVAVTYVASGDYASALPLHERALAVRERALGPDHPEVANSLNNLANVYSGLGRPEEAQRRMIRALAVQEGRFGANDPVVAGMAYNLGNIEVRLHQWEQARVHHERALVFREQVLGRDHLDTAASLVAMGVVYEGIGRIDLAEQRHREALDRIERVAGPDHPALGEPLVALAKIEIGRDRPVLARSLAQRAVEIRRHHEGEPARLAEAEFLVARAQWELHDDRSAARALAQHARDVIASAGAVWAPELAGIDDWLATHI